jgi:hypothetical protein
MPRTAVELLFAIPAIICLMGGLTIAVLSVLSVFDNTVSRIGFLGCFDSANLEHIVADRLSGLDIGTNPGQFFANLPTLGSPQRPR